MLHVFIYTGYVFICKLTLERMTFLKQNYFGKESYFMMAPTVDSRYLDLAYLE